MSSVNKAILLGNLCADPEVRRFNNGGSVCNLRIATNESWKDKNTGEKKQRTEYHSVAIFSEGLVSVAERYLRKGSKCYLEGKIQTRKWQDKDGNDRWSTEIILQGFDAKLVLLDGRQDNTGNQNASQDGPAQSYELDDDVPF